MQNYSTLLLMLLFVVCISCSQNKKPDKLKVFVEDSMQIDPEELSGSEPISQLAKVAAEKADKTIVLTRSNMAQALEEARNYSKVLIVVGTHTLVKVNDFNDCQKSTAWKTKMPMGIGLTQKDGDFEKETGYINTIIGKPDSQMRKMFLFK